jgi:hypothetical protein
MAYTPESPPLPTEALISKALKSLSEFALVGSLARQLGKEQNELGLSEIAIDNGVLVPVNSGLVTPGSSAHQETLAQKGRQLVRTSHYDGLQAYADFVGLWPGGNRGDGEAALYSVSTDVAAEPTVTVYPFMRTLADEMRPADRRAHSLNGRNYWHVPSYKGATLLAEPDHSSFPLMATGDTVVDTSVRGELDGELGLDVSFSGLVKAVLAPRHFYRIGPRGVHATPNEPTPVEFHLPETYTDDVRRRVTTIKSGQRLVPNEDGLMVIVGADEEETRMATDYQSYNPKIKNLHILELAGDKLTWENITALHLAARKKDILKHVGGVPHDAEQLRAKAAAALLERMQDGAGFDEVGCNAVAVRLRDLARQPIDGTRIALA